METSATPFTNCMALGKLLNLPEPPVPHLWNGQNDTCLTGIYLILTTIPLFTTLKHSKVPFLTFLLYQLQVWITNQSQIILYIYGSPVPS